MEKYVIIVAGGKGLRMGGDIPKQFVPINGMPVLMRTIEAFYAYDPQINIILVLPSAHQAYWKGLCEEYHFSIPYQLANGGETRFHSVKRIGVDTVYGRRSRRARRCTSFRGAECDKGVL